MSDKRIPASLIRKVWLDPSLTVAGAAAAVGLSRASLWQRARGLGLPRRKDGRAFTPLPPQFDAMWCAGLALSEMAAICGLSASNISRRARLRGLPRRGSTARPINGVQWAELRLARAMASSAEDSNRAIRAHQALALADEGAEC
jgi:predicted DNA-binding transcriptional regulator AlpA